MTTNSGGPDLETSQRRPAPIRRDRVFLSGSGVSRREFPHVDDLGRVGRRVPDSSPGGLRGASRWFLEPCRGARH